MKSPLVSISCITYNHEPYIRECLDGFLMQQCDFDYEILIHDDASTDKTADIIREYEAKYPDIIKPIYQTENQWSQKGGSINARFNYPRAQGKYIALCEGDDYWIDPLKLQKQVDTLEKNPEINICSHASYRSINNIQTDQTIGYWGDKQRHFSFGEVIMNFAGTAPLHSIVFRTQKMDELMNIISVALGGHSIIQIFYSYPKGLIYLPDKMSVYRVASQSSISKILFKNDKEYLKRQLKNFAALDVLSGYLKEEDRHWIQKTKQKQSRGWISTGNTSFKENCFLIFKYKHYKNGRKLLRALKSAYKAKIKRKVKSILVAK